MRRVIDWDSMPLGQVPDKDLAEKLGVGTATVSRARSDRGIKPASNRHRIKWDSLPYGKYSDKELADMYDVPVVTVATNRVRAGFRRRLGERKPALPPTVEFPPGLVVGDEPPVSWPKERILRERKLYELGGSNEN